MPEVYQDQPSRMTVYVISNMVEEFSAVPVSLSSGSETGNLHTFGKHNPIDKTFLIFLGFLVFDFSLGTFFFSLTQQFCCRFDLLGVSCVLVVLASGFVCDIFCCTLCQWLIPRVGLRTDHLCFPQFLETSRPPFSSLSACFPDLCHPTCMS